MIQKADHPHQSAVHLIKALKCCQQYSESDQVDLIEIGELQYRKNMLAEELRQISIRGESVDILENEIRDLDELIVRLQEENTQIEQEGLNRIELVVEDRRQFQNQEMCSLMTEMEIQIEQNRQLKLEMDFLMDRVRYLNRVNNELVFKFSNL